MPTGAMPRNRRARVPPKAKLLPAATASNTASAPATTSSPARIPRSFLLLLKDLHDRFRPVGQSEEKLVLRIAAGQWRLDRTLPMETGIYRQRLEAVAAKEYSLKQALVNQKRNHELDPERVPPAPAPPNAGDRLARAFIVDCEGPNTLAKLARYETGIERSIDRTLRQLKALQAARNTPSPSPEICHEPPKPSPEPPSTSSDAEDYEANPNAVPYLAQARNPSPITHNRAPAQPAILTTDGF